MFPTPHDRERRSGINAALGTISGLRTTVRPIQSHAFQELGERFSLSWEKGRGEISPNEFAHCAPERGAGTARLRALRFDGFAIWGRAVPTPVHGEVGRETNYFVAGCEHPGKTWWPSEKTTGRGQPTMTKAVWNECGKVCLDARPHLLSSPPRRGNHVARFLFCGGLSGQSRRAFFKEPASGKVLSPGERI